MTVGVKHFLHHTHTYFPFKVDGSLSGFRKVQVEVSQYMAMPFASAIFP